MTHSSLGRPRFRTYLSAAERNEPGQKVACLITLPSGALGTPPKSLICSLKLHGLKEIITYRFWHWIGKKPLMP